jgi:hypothetical protein
MMPRGYDRALHILPVVYEAAARPTVTRVQA